MAKTCKGCGESVFSHDTYLSCGDDGVLCKKCSETIDRDLNNLYKAKTKEEFEELAIMLVGKCKTVFDEKRVENICSVIDKYRFYKNFPASDWSIESVQPIEFECNSTKESTTTGQKKSSSGMFVNVGGKIKIIAKGLRWGGIIAAVITVISFMAMDYGDSDSAIRGCKIALYFLLLSRYSSFLLYLIKGKRMN